MELDHLFIVVRNDGCATDTATDASTDLDTASGARAARMSEALREAGLNSSFSRVHSGQGTANHRFQFDNVMLELLYIHDRVEMSTPPTTALQLEARFFDPDASPFGICSRPDCSGDTDAAYPYALYEPSYLPTNLAVQFADGLPASEPLWFHLPFARRPEEATGDQAPVDQAPGDQARHPSGLRKVASIHLETRQKLSTRSISIADFLHIEITPSQRDHMHLHFEPPSPQCQSGCLTPDPELPLTLHW